MTETQRKFLTEYLGECWHSQETYYDCDKAEIVQRRTFTTAQDKQDLLMEIDKKGEWMEFIEFLSMTNFSKFVADSLAQIVRVVETRAHNLYKWLIQLSPTETAELICKWKGVE